MKKAKKISSSHNCFLPNRRFGLISILSLLVFIFTLFSFTGAFGQPQIRELESDFLDIENTIVDPDNDIIYTSDKIRNYNPQNYRNQDELITTPVLKGGISELRAVVGKSQIIRFDEPVRRMSITKPELVDMVFLSPKEIIMNGKTGGETTVIIWGEDNEPVFFNLFVENNNLNFIKEVKKIAPNEDIEIDFIDTGTDSGLKVVLKGTISSSIIGGKIAQMAAAYGYSIIDLTETLQPQVLLEVKIVELNKTKGKSRGYEFKKGLFDYITEAEKLSGYDFTTDAGDEPWLIDKAIEALVDSGDYGSEFLGKLSGLTFADGALQNWNVFPDLNLAMQLNAAESEGLVKTLSEPRVMVVNGEAANFTSGSEVPVPTGVDELGNQQYDYTNVGTTINITPTILEETERILLTISANISEIDSAISTTAGPGFNTRSGNTTVEIANNHTTVITGLVRKSETKTTDKFPFLSNIPIIGKLFNTETASSDDTELMIFVTASIIKPDMARGGL